MATNEDQTITQPRLRLRKKWILLGLVFIVVPLMIYFAYLIKGKNQLGKVQQEYRDKGYPMTLQELDDWYPAPVGENAAELYIQAAGQMLKYPDWDPGKEILSAFERQPVDGGSFNDEEDGISKPELEDDEALIDRVFPYIRAREMPEFGEQMDPARVALAKSYVQANHQVIETLYKAMTIKESRYPLDFTKGYEMQLPSLGQLRTEANLLAWQALIEIHTNRSDKATQSLLAIYAIARSLEHAPILIFTLVKTAIQSTALSETERTLNRRPLTDRNLVQLSDTIDDLLKSDDLFRGMVGEHILVINAFEDSRALEEIYGEFNVPLLKITGQYDRDHAAFLKISMGQIQASQLPIGQKYNPLSAKVYDLPSWYITRYIYPDFGRAMTMSDRMFTLAIVQKVGLAVERYRLKHNKLPEKLTDLVPEFLEKLPDDPFASKPLHYKKLAGGGFMVYSTGEDATDDGGQRKNSKDQAYVPGSDICFEIRR